MPRPGLLFERKGRVVPGSFGGLIEKKNIPLPELLGVFQQSCAFLSLWAGRPANKTANDDLLLGRTCGSGSKIPGTPKKTDWEKEN